MVFAARRSSGGVSSVLMPRTPARAIDRVRGIGVAVSVSTSTPGRSRRIRSLCSTPKRCSSSTTTSPRPANETSWASNRCVPTTTPVSPAASRASTARSSSAGVKRVSASTRTGNGAKRAAKTSACCSASSVVGAISATCLPSATALNVARIATSVLPYPTSPQSSQSIGRGCSIAARISSQLVRWSGVVSKGNASANSRCRSSSAENANPVAASRSAASRSSSAAISRTFSLARPFAERQAAPPIVSSRGCPPAAAW